MASASALIGELPGDVTAVTHRSPTPAWMPCSSFGMTPARIREDLPQPDGPVTAMKCDVASRSMTLKICVSRPKNSDASSFW